MQLKWTGELQETAVVLSRTTLDAATLLVHMRDPKSQQGLKVVCAGSDEMKESLALAASAAADRPTITLSVEATPLNLTRLTNGKVVGVAYQLLVVGVVEGRPALRLQATQARRQPRPL